MTVQRPDNVYEFFLKIPPSAIPPDETAPDHYTLLGLPRFDNDAAALKQASLARNTELRGWQNSNYYLWSNELLDEVVKALLVRVPSHVDAVRTGSRAIPWSACGAAVMSVV